MKLQLKTSLENSRIRVILWISFISLTSSIFLFPVSLDPEYPLPVQTIYMFSNLSLFSGIFLSWMFILLVLLFSKKENLTEKLALCLVFVLVFSGFWVVISPGGWSGDEMTHMAHVRYLLQEGKVLPETVLTFTGFNFPALHFINAAISQICGLPIFVTRTIFLLTNAVIFSFILFVTFLNILKSPFYASLGVILANGCSILFVTGMLHLIPMALATTFIAVFFLLLSRTNNRIFAGWQERLIFIILAAAATISYIFPPVLFFLILLSIYVLYYLAKEKEFSTLTSVMICLAFALSWEIYVAVKYFDGTIVSGLVKSLENIREGRQFLAAMQEVQANVGLSAPWWVNVTRFFWWLSVFGFGTLLMLKKLLSFKNYGHLERVGIASFVGIVLIVLAGTIGHPGASHGGLVRYLWLAPFVLIPFMIRSLSTEKVRKYGLPFIFLALLLFSFPTFLTNMDTFPGSYIYPQEHSAGEFVGTIYDRGQNLNLYAHGAAINFALYYVPEARKVYGPESYGLKEEEVWKGLDRILTGFTSSIEGNLFITCRGKAKSPYELYQGISPDDPGWMRIESTLSLTNEIYNNGHVKIYSSLKK